MQSEGLSGVFSNTTVQKHQFFGTQLSLWSNSHIHTTTGKTIALTRQTFVGKIMSLIFNMGLDLINRVPEELWMEVRDVVQETGIKTIPMGKNAKKQNGCLGRPYK